MLLLLATLFLFSHASDQEGLKFLEENKDKEGVITLPSGLQYKVLTQGSGTAHPLADTPCDCHYAGQLLDGTEFDSSYKRGSPTSFAPNQVIKGWTEAMQLMVEGDKWEMYIPSELAYGERGSPPKIPGGSVLIFQMEIIKIKGPSKPALSCDPATGDNCNEQEVKFIAKMKEVPKEKLEKESSRLSGISEGAVGKNAEWIARRLFILEKMKKDLEGSKDEKIKKIQDEYIQTRKEYEEKLQQYDPKPQHVSLKIQETFVELTKLLFEGVRVFTSLFK